MKKHRLVAMAVTLLVPVLWAGDAPAAAAGEWKALAASGTVEFDHPDDAWQSWQPVRRGDQLQPLSHLRTGRRGRTTLARQASLIVVDPRSEVILPQATTPASAAVVMQQGGSVIYEVDRRNQAEFRVETPYLVAGVKGTRFIVTVAGGRASVSVREGAVEVTSKLDRQQFDLQAGETLLLREEEDVVRTERVVRARSGEVEGDRSRAVRRASWLHAQRLDEAERRRGFGRRGHERDASDDRGNDDDEFEERVADSRKRDEHEEPDEEDLFDIDDEELFNDEDLLQIEDDESEQIEELIHELEREQRTPADDPADGNPQ